MEEASSHKHYVPSKIEFVPKKNDRYYFNIASSISTGDSSNPNRAKKYKSVLMSEIKKNAQKVSGFLQNSEQINNLVATQIYSETLPDPYIKTRKNSRRSSGGISLLRIKDIIIPHAAEPQRNSLLIKSKKPKRLSEIKDSINTEAHNCSESLAIDTSKLYILPALSLTNDITPQNPDDFTSEIMREEIPSQVLPIIRQTPKNLNKSITPALQRVLKTEESYQKDKKFTLINSTINEYYRKVSARPKETSVDKFMKAARNYEKEHHYNSISLSTNRLEKAKSHKNLNINNTARASIDDRIHSLHTDRASLFLKKGHMSSKSTEKLILPKIKTSTNVTLPTIGEGGSQSLRIKSVFRPPPPESKMSKGKHNKSFKHLYQSCKKLVSNLNTIEQVLTYREIKMNDNYTELKSRLEKLTDFHFLPENMLPDDL